MTSDVERVRVALMMSAGVTTAAVLVLSSKTVRGAIAGTLKVLLTRAIFFLHLPFSSKAFHTFNSIYMIPHVNRHIDDWHPRRERNLARGTQDNEANN